MNRPSRAIAGLAAVALGATLLAGCSSTPSSTAADTGPLTVWLPPLGADKAINQELAAFTKKTGIKTKVEAQNWDNYFQTLTTALTTGEGPDVAAIGNTWTASFQPVGGLATFDDTAFKQFGGKSRFLAAPLTSTSPAGKTPVAVPWLAQAYGLLYSKSAFKKAGITTPPTTWDEFRADGKLLTKDGNYGTAYMGASATGPNTTLLWPIIRQHGGQLFDSAGKPTFTNAGVVAGVKDYLSWNTDKIADPASAEYTGDAQVVESLAKGKVGMVVLQNGGVAEAVAAGMSADDIGVAPTPSLSPVAAGGADVKSHVAGINLVMWENTKHRASAIKLINFLDSAEAQIVVAKAAGSLPVVKDAYTDPTFSSANNKVYSKIVADESEPLPMVPQQGQMQNILGAVITKLIAKGATGGTVSDADISAALKDANDQMAALG